jgi:hypothetical protein
MNQNKELISNSLEQIFKNSAPTVKGRDYKKNQFNRFIKTISYDWISTACQLSGTATRVGLILWFLSGLNNNRTVKLTNRYLDDFGLHRTSKYEGLRQLQKAGLVSVTQRNGSSPSVTINDPPESI